MNTTTSICLENKAIKESENIYTQDNINELSYNARYTYFKHRAKIESLRFFIV